MSTEASETVAHGLTALAGIDLDVLCDEALNGLVVELQRLTHQLAAQTRRWEQRRVWEGDGSKSSAAQLARDGHTSKGAAQRVLLHGRRLDTAPVVAAAFVTGMSTDQVNLLLAAQAGRDELFARDEETLVEQARELRVGQLHQALEYWRHRADAEVNPEGPEPKLPTPSVTLTPIDGAVAINGELDPVGGDCRRRLEAIADELAVVHPELDRSAVRALALVEMARRAMAAPPRREAEQADLGQHRLR